MILKLLLIIAVVYIVYFFFIKKKPIRQNDTKSGSSKESDIKSNDMIECNKCGTYAEVSESILSNGKYYCSKECVKDS